MLARRSREDWKSACPTAVRSQRERQVRSQGLSPTEGDPLAMRARVADSMAHRVSREAQKKNHLPSGPAQQDPVRLLEPVQSEKEELPFAGPYLALSKVELDHLYSW